MVTQCTIDDKKQFLGVSISNFCFLLSRLFCVFIKRARLARLVMKRRECPNRKDRGLSVSF